MITARPYQRRVLDALYAYLENRSGNALIVAPTGSGKSIIPAIFCQETLAQWPQLRFMIVAHVKELLSQNFEKIITVWPDAPAGLYSAGLKKRQVGKSITVAGIQSVFKKPHVFGWIDVLFIDEVHLLSPDSDTMYQKFIAGLRKTNPNLRIIGMTATNYRLKSGMIHLAENSLFEDIACEITLRELLDDGYICPLISRYSEVQADMSHVDMVAGEYNNAQAEAEMDKITERMLDEVYKLGAGRKYALFFCQGVDHAIHVRDAIRARGDECETITGDTPAEERDLILRRFKSGELSKVTNCSVLSTGFDNPRIDLIVLVRATASPGLYVQMLGRGLRPHPDKTNCLVLDFAGNIEKHGPITNVRPPRAKGESKADPNERTCIICPVCRMASELDAVDCADCGYVFTRERKVKHETKASTLDVMGAIDDDWIPVRSVEYAIHQGKAGKPNTLKVTYFCGLSESYSEWVCLDHPAGSFARVNAEKWWARRWSIPNFAPIGVPHGYGISDYLKKPHAIKVEQDGKFWKITAYDLTGRSVLPKENGSTGDIEEGNGDSNFIEPFDLML